MREAVGTSLDNESKHKPRDVLPPTAFDQSASVVSIMSARRAPLGDIDVNRYANKINVWMRNAAL